MTEKPSFVIDFDKPKNTEIKKIGNNWYLYQRFSKYDPTIKRSRKVSGPCLGKITENGLVPTRHRLTSIDQLHQVSSPNDVVEAGATVFLWKLTGKVRERLSKHFKDMWREIYIISLLRILKEPYFKRLEAHFQTNLLSYIFPGISFTPSNKAALLYSLGKRRNDIREFMKEDINQKDVFILFDGHRLITSSKTISMAELGYDSKRRFMPQINLIYIFCLKENAGDPVYYKQFIGSTPDVSAFSDILKDSGLSGNNCTVIADKGFASEDDFILLEERDLKYIIPLRRGNRFSATRLPLTQENYTDLFTYNRRAIQAFCIKESEFNVFVYKDTQLWANEMADFALRGEKQNNTKMLKKESEIKRRKRNKGRLTDEEMADLEPDNLQETLEDRKEMGTITIRTNRIELNSEQVYRIYKNRQAIEQFFRIYESSLDFEASYMRDNVTQEAWLFLNHVSSMMVMDCINSIANIDEDKNISFEDLRQLLGKIMVSKKDDEWQINPIKKSVEKLISKLGFNLTPENIEEVIREGRHLTEQRT